MGIVKRQSLKASVVSYFGAVIGIISVIFIMPYCLSPGELGLLRVINDAAMFFGMLALFGSSYSVLYFFPRYSKDGKRLNGMLSFLLLLALIGFVVIVLLLLFFKSAIIRIYSENASALLDYLYILPLLIFFSAAHQFFETHSANFLRITIPKIVREVLMRILLIASVLMFFYHVINFNGLVISQLFILIVATVIIWYYISKISHHPLILSLDFPEPEQRKEIIRFNFYVWLAVFGVMLSSKIDSFFLIRTVDGLAQNGIYTTAVFIIAMIELPTRSMISISTPLLSKATHENNLKEVDDIYKKSSITLLTAGLFIFLCIWLNIDNIFGIMPKGGTYALGKMAVLYLGLSKLFDASTSVNYTIINVSKYYRFSLFFQLIQGVLTIGTAWYLIPRYGINGAAISTALSVFMYQLMCTLFVRAKFKTIPFSLSSLKILVIGVAVYLVCFFIPLPFSNFIQIIARSSIIALLFIPLTYYFKISQDINDLADGVMIRLKIKK